MFKLNAAQMFHIAMGFFRKVEAVHLKPPKERKVKYGETLRSHFAAKRLEAIQAKK